DPLRMPLQVEDALAHPMELIAYVIAVPFRLKEAQALVGDRAEYPHGVDEAQREGLTAHVDGDIETAGVGVDCDQLAVEAFILLEQDRVMTLWSQDRSDGVECFPVIGRSEGQDGSHEFPSDG